MSLSALPSPLSPDEEKEVLADAGTLASLTLGLATGALVFSVGLLTAASDHLWLLPRIFLVFSWLCLAISILTGVMVRSQIPVKLSKKNYKIDDRIFNIEGRVHAGSFVLGVVTLGLALLFTLIKIPIEQVAAVDSAREALDRAKTELTPDEHARLSRLDVIEEIKGGDGNALPDGIWHIRFSLGSQGSKIRSNNSTIDVIVPIRSTEPLRRIP